MKPILRIFPLLFLFFINGSDPNSTYLYADDGHGPWKLITTDGDIKVYKRTREGTDLKEVRIDNVFHVPAADLVRELDDADNYFQWIYKCGESKVLATPSENEIVYYTLANVPSPVWDRDIVAHSFYEYNPETKTHFYQSHVPENDAEYMPERKKVVRVKDYGSTWTIKEVGENKIETINTVYMDPGGSIPNWLANMTLTKGPTKSMKGLEKRLYGE